MSKILTPRKRSFCAAGSRLVLLSRSGRRLGRKTLRTAIQSAVRHLHRHEEQVLVNGHVALPARTHHRSQQSGLRRIGDVVDVDAVKVSLKQVIALERQVRVGKSELSDNQLERLWHLRGVADAE